MSHRFRTAVACAFILLAALPFAAAAQESQDTASLPEALRSVRTALAQAYGKLDGTASTAHFTDDAVVEFQGQVLSGKPAVGGWFAQMFSSLSAVRIGSSTFVVGDGEVTERASYTVVMQSGEEGQGQSEMLWKRQADGSWKVARLIVL